MIVPMIFAPFLLIYAVLFFVLLAALFGFIEIGLIRYAFVQLGLPPEAAFAALLASLLGSYINIPITRISSAELHPVEVVGYYGMRYRVPVHYANSSAAQGGSTMLAVNVGGAVVPVLIVIYILSHHPAIWPVAMVATAIVALLANRFARPVPGLGIAMPMFVPPITAALAAYFLAPSDTVGVAYVAGVTGTLIGADLANLHKLSALGAPVASIGGAGTFDGIFLTGIVAVLLA